MLEGHMNNAFSTWFIEGKDNKTSQQRNRTGIFREQDVLDEMSHQRSVSHKPAAY
jgi:hypothetical protein